MAYSDSFPAVRPVFQSDFANGGRIDPRISYTRSTTGTYFGKDKHLSSENLLKQSSDFDTTWSPLGIGTPTGGQTDPSGGSSGFTLVEDTSSATHRVYQLVASSGKSTLTVYAKQNSGTRYLSLCLNTGAGTPYDWVVATFDLAGSSPVMTTGSDATGYVKSSSQSASGNGYYKCVITVEASAVTANVFLSDSTTPSPANYGHISYTGDGSSSINVAFASLSTTGATDYNATTTQIHREYAPTLQTAAINAPRFEHSATDGQSAGTSLGCLIESQSSNLLSYSQNFDDSAWTKYRATITANAAVAPSGELTADLFVSEQTGSAQTHIVESASQAFTSGTAYTFSIFVKPAGFSKIRIAAANTSTWAAAADYDLSGSGSVSGVTGTASAEAVGNGWFRCILTGTAGASASTPTYVFLDNGSGTSFDGDDYSGVLIWGAQFEQSSFASSYISTLLSARTRAADSLSVATADIGYTGGPVALFAESSTQSPSENPNNRAVVDLSEATASNNRVMIYNLSGQAGGLFVNADNSQQAAVAGGVTDDSYAKVAVSVDTNSIKHCVNGGTVSTDTSAVIPEGMTKLFIGQTRSSGSGFGGHIKRVAIYPALTDTNLQALTS